MDDAAPSATGLADPMATTPARRPASMRRTSHIDMVSKGPELDLAGAARDLYTGTAGDSVVGSATVEALLDRERRVTRLETTPPDPRTQALMGLVAGKGFRAAVDAALPEPADAASPLYLLLDDLPVAALISGYANLYTGRLPARALDMSLMRSDICSGWALDGTMMTSLRTEGRIPLPLGPAMTDLTPDDDPLAWHDIGPLPVGGMRRRRLVEVTAPADDDEAGGDALAVFAMFRDTYVQPEGTEMVLHEYTLTADLDPTSLVLSGCKAHPRVLPWTECPEAAASAARLDGHDVDEVRALVSKEFKGTTTCTHLNDLLRSLADLGPLTRLLRT